ncbi:LptF/LptG family permease [Planctomycetales bacterium 10988]|nr:LptF/LptG family permease [Planctomycetales bacterium 10988]
MTRIDRYLLTEFLKTFFICFCSLSGLLIVFHAFSSLDSFLEWTTSTKELLFAMGEYYSYQLIFLFEKISPVVVVIAAMFTITWFQRHNEMIALWAAGLSTRRLVLPILGMGMMIAGVDMGVREWVIPQFKDELTRSPEDWKGERAQEVQPRYDQWSDILIQGFRSYAAESRIEQPNFILPVSLVGQTTVLSAGNAFYLPSTSEHPAGYLLKDVIEPIDLTTTPSLRNADQELVLFTPADQAWLEPNDCFVVSELTFEQLTAGATYQTYTSTYGLIQTLYNSSFDHSNDVKVTIHSRIVKPLLDCTLLFLGLPFVLKGNKQNVFVAIGICVTLVISFFVVIFTSHALGGFGLINPSLAAWLPLMVFIPLAIYLSEPLLN